MALVSFRLRRTDDVGSYVREEARLDSAIRSDNYVAPSETFGTSTFDVFVLNVEKDTVIDASRPSGEYTQYTSTVELSWTLETELETNPASTAPVGIWIVVNQYGEPVTVEDGNVVFSCDASTYVETTTHISTTLKPGSWLYYGFFIKYSDGTTEWFEQVATQYVQIPKYYESTATLWNKIPEYYRALDASSANNNLYDFLSLFGWELDKIKSLIDSVVTINDPLISTTPALELIAKQLGIPNTAAEIGTNKLRNILLNVFELRKRKGTAFGTAAYVSALSGCPAVFDTTTNTLKVTSQRVNLISDPKFRQQDVSFYVGTPSVIDRTPFILRSSSGGAALRNPDSNDDALRAYTSNPLSLGELAEYTTVTTTNTAASVGWGVYTYGASFDTSASVPNIDNVIYDGEIVSGASVSTVASNGNGLRIEIPSNASGSQTVVVYGRKPFYYRETNVYNTSFYANLSGASFINFRFIAYDDIINTLEIDPPDYYGETLFHDSWNTGTADSNNLFLYGADSNYNASSPGLATIGRYAVEHPQALGASYTEIPIVPALVFTANPGDIIILSKWLVEPNSFGKYFDGDEIFGGFVREANQASPIGLSDYRWGPDGGNTNQDFSYYTLDYGRVVSAVTRVVEEHLLPITLINTYTIEWNVIPGD